MQNVQVVGGKLQFLVGLSKMNDKKITFDT